MDKKRRAHASAAHAGSSSILAALDEDAQAAVLCAAKAAGVLAPLASSSKQLCRLARSRLQLQLFIHGPEEAAMFLECLAQGRPPFTGTTCLAVAAEDPETCLMTVAVLTAVQQWPYLERLALALVPAPAPVQQPLWLDHSTSGVLSMLPALKQLRFMCLELQGLGACSAAHLGQLQQLQELELHLPEPSCNDAAADTAAAAAAAAVGAAPDLTALSRMTSLVELVLHNAPAVQPAAGQDGPWSLPSSLTKLEASTQHGGGVSAIACWLTHLPGCPQLQHLELEHDEQHASAHPAAVARLVKQHHPQLRVLSLCYEGPRCCSDWVTHVEGLPDVPEPEEDGFWHPDAALAALKKLEFIESFHGLEVASAADWQHLAQLPSLTKLAGVRVCWAPTLPAANALRLLELERCELTVDGHELGRLLLACPALERASVVFVPDDYTLAADGPPLAAHPALKVMMVSVCSCGIGDLVAHFAALAPVLGHVQELSLTRWRTFNNGSVRDIEADSTLPDLSPCTALTCLEFGCYSYCVRPPVPQEQEDFLSMVAPLVQLQRLVFEHAERLNARVAPLLQHMLPQLQLVKLYKCGKLLPSVAAGDVTGGEEQHQQQQQQQQQQREEQALAKVQRLLRPGLVLQVDE